jgi:D-alanine-D-alanine ligase
MPNREQGRRTLGPVTDLERHLPPEWWRTLFNALYLKTDGDVVDNEENTVAEVDALVSLARLEPDSRILDLCCGHGRHVLELARRGFRNVTGLDRSRTLIRLARTRARKADLDVRFHEGDARRFRLPGASFDCVAIMGNSFGYFKKGEDDLAVLHSAAHVLRSSGTLVLDLADGDWLRRNFEPRSWEWIGQDQFVCRERSLSRDSERLISREVVVHAQRGVIADQFYAERLYDGPRIELLLKRAGYVNLEIFAGTDTRSDRNQDLGMMAHRMLVRAASECVTRRRKPTIHYPNVTVLLGDPSLPDPVKRDGRFNPEDRETVERLYSALAELKGFKFEYLNDHASLTDRLRETPPEFVFNLCDEGFGNDALRELGSENLSDHWSVPITRQYNRFNGAIAGGFRTPQCIARCWE